MSNLIGITGDSNAGKTTVVRFFQNIGYYKITCDLLSEYVLKEFKLSVIDDVRASEESKIIEMGGTIIHVHRSADVNLRPGLAIINDSDLCNLMMDVCTMHRLTTNSGCVKPKNRKVKSVYYGVVPIKPPRPNKLHG